MDKEKRFKLYVAILKKYKDLINSEETKTVGEIKALINKNDLTIHSLIQEAEGNDSFAKFKNIYQKVQKEITFAKSKVNVNFWFTPNELMKYKVGDDEDLAVLLCSTLISLGFENSFVVILELEDLSTHAVVITEHNNEKILLDITQIEPIEKYKGTTDEIFFKYRFDGKTIKKLLYKFNDSTYEQFF